MRAILTALLCCVCVTAFAGGLPIFVSDAAADQWLRESSAYYRKMAAKIDAETGYSFRTSDELSAGMVEWESGKPVIALGDSLSGGERVSILIFELTNIYQSSQHQEIDRAANEGRMTDKREFGIRHELIELDGLRHHRIVLVELDQLLNGLPVEMLTWISPKAVKLSDYELPFAHDFIKAQEASGHTAHYHEWFFRQAPADAAPGKK